MPMMRVAFMGWVGFFLIAEVHLLHLYSSYGTECLFELCPFLGVTLQVEDDKGLSAAGTLMELMEPETRLDQVIVL